VKIFLSLKLKRV